MNISTLDISQQLQAHGFTKAQADGIANALFAVFDSSDKELATKDFVSAKISEVRTEISEVRTELKAEIHEVRNEISKVRAEMGHLKYELIKWMVGLQFATFTLIFGLIYFLVKN